MAADLEPLVKFLGVFIMLIPWAVAIAHSSYNAYMINNFDSSEIQASGSLDGNQARSLNILSGATLGLAGLALFKWFEYWLLSANSRVKISGEDKHYKQVMMVFWSLILLQMILGVTLSAMDIRLVSNYNDEDVTLDGKKLDGAYGNAVHGITYTAIAVGGTAFLTFVYGMFHAAQANINPKVTITY